jgi:hypothetical protein
MRLLVHVEGQTEETFVNEVLAPHLYEVGYESVSARLLGAARARRRRGGICTWPVARDEIYRHLSNDSGAYATTLVDYYALPADEEGWPGRAECAAVITNEKSEFLAGKLQDDFQTNHPTQASRFIPYVAMHEFEALLFSDAAAMARGFGNSGLAATFQAIRDQFASPEHINDSPITAPSKRILAAVPGYQKVLQGNLAALEVGLDVMRQECPGFDLWLTRLEALPASSTL